MHAAAPSKRQELHYLQESHKPQNQLEDHTCGLLASCAVVASSLQPPFARAISKTLSTISF